MKWRLYKLTLLGCVALGEAAQACNQEDFEPPDAQSADVVVVGRISNYRLLPNRDYVESTQRTVESAASPTPPPFITGILPGRFYGKFEVVVDKVLKGKVDRKFSATFRPYWPCCYGSESKEVLPKRLQSGRYLIALDRTFDRRPFGNSRDTALLTSHIELCIGAFIMKMPDATWFEKEVEKYLAKQRTASPKR